MIGSRRVLRWAIVHAGVTRRSEAELADLINSGMSDDVCGADMMDRDAVAGLEGAGGRWPGQEFPSGAGAGAGGGHWA